MAEHSSRKKHAEDQEKIDRIRSELPAVQKQLYMNTGTNGPLPRRSHEALVQAAEAELNEGRASLPVIMRMFESFGVARAKIAAILGCDPLEVALTHNTTEGMNIALMGLDWQKGDELVTANTEHPGILHPAYLLSTRYGVRLRMTDIGLPHIDPLEALKQAITSRTRVVSLSHVSWATGMTLPIRELAEITHRAGALFICDAAQSCGMVPSNVYDLGVDAYACSGQKWLCGPDGTGALFVRKDRLTDIKPTYLGYAGVKRGMGSLEGYFVPSDGAQRFEAATLYPPGIRAFITSLTWLLEDVGLEWIYDRVATLGRYCHRTLRSIDGVTMHSSKENLAGLVHFTVDGMAPPDVSTKLREKNIIIRELMSPAVNRVSLGFYNTVEEIDQLAEAIAALRPDDQAALVAPDAGRRSKGGA
ncbi:MAG TPA: aminotransferase class V-fold PLP-dependent enzyme [Ktedonobacterales bacterium]|jgi:L-cysteine/cystine lyase